MFDMSFSNKLNIVIAGNLLYYKQNNTPDLGKEITSGW